MAGGFDVDAARNAGYSDEEILDEMSKRSPGFDTGKALQSGYSTADVINFLQTSHGASQPHYLGDTTISALVEGFLTASQAAPQTLKVYRYVLEANILPKLGSLKASKLTTPLLQKYRKDRRASGVEDSTVNRETSILRIAFNWGKRQTPPQVMTVPHFPMVRESNVRQGYLSEEEYQRLKAELPEELRPLFIVAYATGVRRGELLKVRWEQVSFEDEEIVLRRGETKNGDGRVLPFLTQEMQDVLVEAKRLRDERWPTCEWVFSRHGEPIKDFRAAWDGACQRAQIPKDKAHFHDLRRTSLVNLRRAGVPQVVRMRISGHKTDSMERRYSIVDAQDFEAAKAAMRRRKEGL